MRRKTLAVSLMVLVLTVLAGAQTKISGTLQCGKPEAQNSIQVGDRPNHAFMITQVKCTWTEPLEIGGAESKEDLITFFDEVTGNSSRSRAFVVGTMASGDKFHVRAEGSGTLKEGAPESGEGKWRFASGTGKLRGIKGAGTYKGKAAGDGFTYEVEGEYTLPKK